MYNNNLLLDTDSYKASHWLQYPKGTEYVYSYLESRGGMFDTTVFFGLQPLLEKLSRPITMAMVLEANDFFAKHGVPFNYEGWKRLVDKLGGKLPIRIKAVKEGSVIPTKNVLLTVENTDAEFAWLTSYLETYLMRVWYPTTVASLSYHCKKLIMKGLEQTSDDPVSEIGFKLHDFGSRGVSSAESAAIGGAAHLVNFMGSDTVLGVVFANEVYQAGMAGFSIPAAEHSTITSWGREHELDAYRNMLDKFARPNSLVAVVSDSYDMKNAVENLWGKELRQQIIDSGATVVIRPDSGVPHVVVLETLRQLEQAFGVTINKKGYKVLNYVRVIQGDGINYHSLRDILDTITLNGYSVTNVAFGMGGGLLQQVNRDSFKFAYKCSSITVNGVERDVFKDPKGEPFKKSKAGKFHLAYDGVRYETVRQDTLPTSVDYVRAIDALDTVFENGEILRVQTFADIRERAKV